MEATTRVTDIVTRRNERRDTRNAEETLLKLPPRSSLAAACGYTLNRWEALRVYLDSGWVNIDNTPSNVAPQWVARIFSSRGATAVVTVPH